MSRFLSIAALVLSTGLIYAADSSSATTSGGISAYSKDVIGSFGALFIGAIQLAVGLALIAFTIKTGLVVLSTLLGGLDIWAEIKKRNIAVALVAAGVVISYTGVIGTGVDSMTKPLAGLVSASASAWLGAITGLISGLIQLLVAFTVASLAITVTFKVLDHLTKDIDEKAELLNGNIAIGALYCGVLIGVSQVVQGAVSGVGVSLQGFLSTLARPLLG